MKTDCETDGSFYSTTPGEEVVAEPGPDQHRGGVVEEEVGREVLTPPRQPRPRPRPRHPQHEAEGGAAPR